MDRGKREREEEGKGDDQRSSLAAKSRPLTRVLSRATLFHFLRRAGKRKDESPATAANRYINGEFHWKTQLCKLNCVQSWWKDFGKGIMPSRLTEPNPYMNLYIAMSGAQNTEQRYKSEKAATWCMCGKWQGRRLRVVSTNIGRRP